MQPQLGISKYICSLPIKITKLTMVSSMYFFRAASSLSNCFLATRSTLQVEGGSDWKSAVKRAFFLLRPLPGLNALQAGLHKLFVDISHDDLRKQQSLVKLKEGRVLRTWL